MGRFIEVDDYSPPSRTQAIDVISQEKDMGLGIYEKSYPRFNRPDWQHPNSWELTLAGDLKPGDAIRLGGYTYLFIKRLRWRQKIANILVHLVGDATKYKRIGCIDYVPAFRNYVQFQRDDRNGIHHTEINRELKEAEDGAWLPESARWLTDDE